MQPHNSYHRSALIQFLVLLIAFSFRLSAQDITVNPPNVPAGSHYFYVEPGQPISLQFVYSGPSPGSWSIADVTPNFMTETGATMNSSTGLFQCVIPPDPSTTLLRFNVTCGTYSEEYRLGVVDRYGAHVMLVLDKSGSMGQEVSGSSTDTKWDVLKNSVSNFLTACRLWEVKSPASALTAGKVLVED